MSQTAQGNQNFLVQVCEACKNEIIVDAGDKIYGGKWYHLLCWELLDEKPATSESSTDILEIV
jgi:hypothetical protein